MVLGNSLSKGLLCRIITLEFSTQIYYILLKTIALFFHEEDLINQLKKKKVWNYVYMIYLPMKSYFLTEQMYPK